jgi:hypothetical protein
VAVVDMMVKPFAGQIERFVRATEAIALNSQIIAISMKQIARNTAVQAGVMETPREKIRYPE